MMDNPSLRAIDRCRSTAVPSNDRFWNTAAQAKATQAGKMKQVAEHRAKEDEAARVGAEKSKAAAMRRGENANAANTQAEKLKVAGGSRKA